MHAYIHAYIDSHVRMRVFLFVYMYSCIKILHTYMYTYIKYSYASFVCAAIDSYWEIDSVSCICMHVFMYVCMYTYIAAIDSYWEIDSVSCIFMHVFMYVCMYVCMYVYIDILQLSTATGKLTQ